MMSSGFIANCSFAKLALNACVVAETGGAAGGKINPE